MLALLAPTVAAAVAALFAVALARQWHARRRPHALAWAISLGLFAVGTAAIAVGVGAGWNRGTFAVYWISGALLTVPFLAVGQLHLLAPRLAHLWWLIAGVYTAAAVSAIGTTYVDVTAFAAAGSGIPTGAQVYGSGPAMTMLRPANYAAAIVVAGSLWSGLRTRRWGVVLIAVGVIVAGASFSAVRVGAGALTSVLLACGVTLMYGGFIAAGRPARRRTVAQTATS